MGDDESGTEEDVRSKLSAEGVVSPGDGAVVAGESLEDYIERFRKITLKGEAGQVIK